MSEDINSPRVRQVLAIHAEQAAEAKALLTIAEARIVYLTAQLDEMFKVTLYAAERLRKIGDGDEIERRAREHIDAPGQCSCKGKTFSGTCPICGEDDGLPF